MKIDVVCPLFEAAEEIDGFLTRLQAQTGVEIQKKVFAVTKSADFERTVEKLQAAGCDYFLVEKEDFSHSLTRQKAIYEHCESDVVIMMSQDVVLENEDALLLLASAVSAEVPYAYGRQICKKKTIEFYVRNKNYGSESLIVSQADVEKMQLKAFFASDAFSAYHRPTFLSLGGYDDEHMMMSEDMYYAKKVIDAGLKKAYVAEAVVEHSHKLTLKQLYNRYYQTGIWFANHPQFDNYKTTDSGLKLATYVFKKALLHFNIPVLFRFIPDMLARYLGMKKGKKCKPEVQNA
ncbi:MAG: rhamnosyltransferase [Clostridia bacterium]|nr:rhamnosyltransferase [Clostridia bacterium]